jgi:hypothetical protein
MGRVIRMLLLFLIMVDELIVEHWGLSSDN